MIIEQLNKIGQRAYSTKETLKHSYDMGKYVNENNIPGVIIECGLGAGSNFASMMLGGGTERKYCGFDSFEGIQLAGKKDTMQAGIGVITHDVNVPDSELLVSSGITSHSLSSVVDNLHEWDLGFYNFRLTKGWVQNTIPNAIDEIKKHGISILRLDMDIYDPTKFCLEKLYPLLSIGGVLIIDDWELDGVRIACEEYFEGKNAEWISIENSEPKYLIKNK